MKKLFLLISFAFLAISSVSAQANDWKDYTHWSISVNGGMSQFDGDVKQDYNQLLSGSVVSWTAGLDLEYTINPIWGIIGKFQYIPYQGYTSTTTYGQNNIDGNMYAMNLLASINLFNLFGQYRTSWRWNMYMNAGFGVTFYDVKSTPVEGSAPGPETPKTVTDGRNISFPLGINVEYNINKYLAVGVLAYYHLHNKDNFEGQEYTKGTMNDGAWYVGANFRVKLVPNKKIAHMRNISMMDYRLNAIGESNLQEQLDSLEKRVVAIEDTLDNNVFPRIKALEEQHAVEPDADKDGVPDFRDREPNTPIGSFVNYWGESLPQELLQPNTECCDEIKANLLAAGVIADVDYGMSVYFGFDESNTEKEAEHKVDMAVAKLNANPESKVEVRGYCDFPGSKQYNLNLSKRRVDTVKKMLIARGIDSSRITVNAEGSLANPPRKEQKNRRCDFIFY